MNDKCELARSNFLFVYVAGQKNSHVNCHQPFGNSPVFIGQKISLRERERERMRKGVSICCVLSQGIAARRISNKLFVNVVRSYSDDSHLLHQKLAGLSHPLIV